MYAVIQVGSSQFKVSVGDMIKADRVAGKEGGKVKLDKVLMYAKGSDVRIGQPYLSDVKVSGQVVAQTAASKVTAFKYRRRKNSATKHGHRHKLTAINITDITV